MLLAVTVHRYVFSDFYHFTDQYSCIPGCVWLKDKCRFSLCSKPIPSFENFLWDLRKRAGSQKESGADGLCVFFDDLKGEHSAVAVHVTEDGASNSSKQLPSLRQLLWILREILQIKPYLGSTELLLWRCGGTKTKHYLLLNLLSAKRLLAQNRAAKTSILCMPHS